VTPEDAIVRWMIEQLSRELHLNPSEIDPTRPIATYGVDSLTTAGLAADLEDTFGVRITQDAFRSTVTILDVARLASGSPVQLPRAEQPSPAAADSAATDVGARDSGAWTARQRTILRIVRTMARMLARIEVSGLESVADGPLVLASNHLHILDAVWLFSVVPRPTVALAADEFQWRPLVGWLLRTGNTIFVARGKGDLAALDQAVRLLQRGGCVAIAPEGRLSRTGGLLKGQTGVALLAAKSGAPVVPVAIHGQQRAGRQWLTLRRPHIRVRFGLPIPPPPAATAKNLELFTETVMRALARMLPPEARGHYRDDG
jgi:1-acyl-sn-glycerol-3-phosphate acyltransferase